MNFLVKRVKGNSIWADATRRFLQDKLAVLSFFTICLYVTVAVLVKLGLLAADWGHGEESLREAPAVFGSDWRAWMGYDFMGRSIFLKMIYGTYTALYVGLMTSLISIPIGVVLGAVAGYFGGWIDECITWLYTMISNIPDFLLLVAIAYSLGKGIFAVNIALGLTTWVSLARLIRAEFMKHKNREYVVAASALGAGHIRKIFIHILPNVVHIIIISFSLRFVTAIKSEVVLTYLGLGAEQGVMPSWGVIIDESRSRVTHGEISSLMGVTLAMFFVVLAFSIFSDALRDAFDPKIRT
jgi:ABC-type dipeptide/oligopeptide/nickel transport system permease subunit